MERAELEGYIDVHNWIFTPSSFELMMVEMQGLGLVELSVEKCQEAVYTEFYAWLRPCAEVQSESLIQERRIGLMNRIIVELAEASRQVSGSPLAGMSAVP
jgi:hypothetical protein